MSYRLGIDFGSSSTVAALADPDGRTRPLLFDASPLLSSAVFFGPDARWLTGADAERAALVSPAGLEPTPKRRIDDGTVWLGEREIGVRDLIAAVLRRVAEETARVTGGRPADIVLTHPAGWGPARLGVLAAAAAQAGLGAVRLVPEPVAAAAYFVRALGRTLSPGRHLVVYDFGAGTFDVSVVRPATHGFDVVASGGLPDVGGLDLDATVVAHVRSLTGSAPDAWKRLDQPRSTADQQARNALWRSARAAKEQLSRHPAADVHVPLAEVDVHLTRDEFEKFATPLLDRTCALTLTVLRNAGVPPEDVAGLFLVGGSSRVPLASTLLHRALGIAPTALDHPELVVAEGSLLTAVPAARPAIPTPEPGVPVPVPPSPRRRRALGGVAAAVVLAIVATLAILRPWESSPTSSPKGDAITGATRVAAIPAHAKGATAVTFSPDSTLLATAGNDLTVRFWNTTTRKKAGADLDPPDMLVAAFDFSPSGTQFVTLNANNVRIWDMASRTPAHPDLDTDHGISGLGTLSDVMFSTDGTRVRAPVASSDVLEWDPADGRWVSTYSLVAGSETTTEQILALSPDGTKLAVIDNGLQLHDVQERRPFGAPLTDEDGSAAFEKLAFSPDGKILAAVDGLDNTIVLFDVRSGKQIGTGFDGHTTKIEALAFSADGSTVASAGTDSRILLWNVAERRQIGAPLVGHAPKATYGGDYEITALAFSPDGKYLASASTDTTVVLWSLTRG